MYMHICFNYVFSLCIFYFWIVSEAVKWVFYRNVYYKQQNSVIYPVIYSDAKSSIFSIDLAHLFISSYYATSLSKLKVDSIFQKLLSRLKHTHKKQSIFIIDIEKQIFLKKQMYLQNNLIISFVVILKN